MPQQAYVPILVSAAMIGFLIWLLPATRKSLSDSDPTGLRYPSGYWMGIGISAGVVCGLLMGVVVRSMTGAISIGIGLGLLLGNFLNRHYEPLVPQFVEEQKQPRLNRAVWRLKMMVLLILAALTAAFQSLLT